MAAIYDIAKRCLRELRGSTSLPMLAVAYRYYRLYYEMMIRKRVPVNVISKIDTYVLKVYKNKKRKLSEQK